MVKMLFILAFQLSQFDGEDGTKKQFSLGNLTEGTIVLETLLMEIKRLLYLMMNYMIKF